MQPGAALHGQPPEPRRPRRRRRREERVRDGLPMRPLCPLRQPAPRRLHQPHLLVRQADDVHRQRRPPLAQGARPPAAQLVLPPARPPARRLLTGRSAHPLPLASPPPLRRPPRARRWTRRARPAHVRAQPLLLAPRRSCLHLAPAGLPLPDPAAIRLTCPPPRCVPPSPACSPRGQRLQQGALCLCRPRPPLRPAHEAAAADRGRGGGQPVSERAGQRLSMLFSLPLL